MNERMNDWMTFLIIKLKLVNWNGKQMSGSIIVIALCSSKQRVANNFNWNVRLADMKWNYNPFLYKVPHKYYGHLESKQ